MKYYNEHYSNDDIDQIVDLSNKMEEEDQDSILHKVGTHLERGLSHHAKKHAENIENALNDHDYFVDRMDKNS